jgi:hypothetical protein
VHDALDAGCDDLELAAWSLEHLGSQVLFWSRLEH